MRPRLSLTSLPPIPAGGVLVVDDDPDARALVVRWLTSAGIPSVEAGSGEQALEMILVAGMQVDCLVLDVVMPGLSGFDVIARLKGLPEPPRIPILLLTAHANAEADVVRGVELGAIDHLGKPFSGPVLVAKVRAACDRAHLERELRLKLQFAQENAAIDPLTGLFNRRYFDRRLREETAHSRRHLRPFAVVMFDLDHFKVVNDTFGHEEGDRVLVHVAANTRGVLREDDTAYRYGGEEFIVLLRDSNLKAACVVAARLRQTLIDQPIRLGTTDRVIAFSAGVAAADADNGFSAGDIVARADAGLYRAKRAGRDRCEQA